MTFSRGKGTTSRIPKEGAAMTFKKYPGAAWKPLGTQSEPAMTGHHLVIVHTMVGYLYSTDGMFRQGGDGGPEAPDSEPGRRGLAYHRQGVDPWRVDGGQRWSTAYGKECPGPTRIRQLSEEIIPRARQISEGDMPLESTDVVKVWDSPDSDLVEHEALDKDPVTNTYPPDNPDNPNWRPASMLTESNRVTRQNRRSLLKLEAQVGEIVGDLTAVTGAL